ncbi:hypothetical protein BGZ49_007538 [Haplosporangium sp. Z 27]|nr:hypothetical protein BGZ49_007538 [Haplosporangium sp. Z 27]
MTTTDMTPTPSASSLSVISSAVGSSLTTGIMEQVRTWRTGADTDDDDEASLEIYSNPSLNRSSFPSQFSRGESQGSGGSLLNGIEIMPTLQLQFPQHPLVAPDDSNLFNQSVTYSDIMPPPSSTTSGYRRHSMSSHQQRPGFNRMKRPSQEDNSGDQFVPSTTRSPFQAITADILSRSVRQSESRFQGGIATSMDSQGDKASSYTVNKSGFPSPQSTTPSPRVAPIQIMSGSIRGDGETLRHSSSQPAPFRISPNQLENSRQRSQSRRSLDEVEDEDDPMQRDASRQPFAPSPRFMKEDPRLRDLGVTLQKSLSFNGDDEYQDLQQRNEEPLTSNTRSHGGRHHPYQARPRPDAASQRMHSQGQRTQFENFIQSRKGKARATEEDRETVGKTPVLLNAINTSQTNILSELQTAQRLNQEELAHFREELYASLQFAFTKLSDQVEGVGRAVASVESAQRDTAQQLGLSVGSAMGDGFTKMSETIQQQIQFHIQQALQPYQINPSRPASIRQGSPFSTSYSQSLGPPTIASSNAYTSYGGFGSAIGGSRQNFGGRNAAWRRSDSDLLESRDDHEEEEEEDNGRGKRRAVERPRSTSGSRRTIDRPRREFES